MTTTSFSLSGLAFYIVSAESLFQDHLQSNITVSIFSLLFFFSPIKFQLLNFLSSLFSQCSPIIPPPCFTPPPFLSRLIALCLTPLLFPHLLLITTYGIEFSFPKCVKQSFPEPSLSKVKSSPVSFTECYSSQTTA